MGCAFCGGMKEKLSTNSPLSFLINKVYALFCHTPYLASSAGKKQSKEKEFEVERFG